MPATETVTLEEMRYGAQRMISEKLLDHHRIRVDVVKLLTGDLIFSASWSALARKAKTTVSYPSNWWEALKDRWFPAWAKQRWPVQRETWRAHEVLPAIRWPEQYRTQSFYTFEKAYE